MNISEYNGVWVFAEQRNGELQKVSLEILGEGRRLANELGVSLDYLVGTHIKKKKNYQECRKYENQIIEKVKCLNKMQLLYVLDTIELLNKYNWGDEKIE